MADTSQSSEVDESPHYEEFEHEISPPLKASIAFMTGFLGTITLTWVLGVPLGSLMEKLQDSFLYHFIPFLFSVTFFGVLIYKAYVKDIKGLNFLAGAVLLHGIAELLNMFSSGEGELFDRADFTASVADLLFPIAVVLLYLHIELIEKTRPSLIHSIGIIGTAAPIIIGGSLLIVLRPILDPIDSNLLILDDIKKVVLVYLGIFSLVILWISLFAMRVMYRTLKHADTKSVSNGSFLVLVGFASLLTDFMIFGVSYSSGFRDDPLLFNGNEFVFHNSYLVTFALFCMLGAYVMNPEFAYAPPFDVYQLIVINSEFGVTLFSFVNEFRSEGSLTHSALKSPAIVAIQNLVQEISHAEGHIILIGMSDRVLMMKSHKQVVSVLIAQKNSYFINKGLNDFNKEFFESFKDQIENFSGNVDDFKQATKLIRKYLPFMRKESLLEAIN